MINISTLLKTISDAIYGEDMRSAIHDALEKVSNNAATDSDLQNEAAARQSADAALGNVKADKSHNSGFIGGSEARLNGVGGAAIGYKAQASLGGAAGNTSKADEGGAVGYGANTNHGGAVGKDAQSMHGGAVGRNAVTRLGAAIGDGAQTVDEDGNPITAIQLGAGVNNEENTAKFFDYTIMNADGSIPPERLNGDFYTKNETDTKIAEAQSIIPVRHIVDELPTENINTRDTYLVPVEDPNDNNVYTEYVYIDGQWEVIGSPFEVDLSSYYTKDEIDGKLESEDGGFKGGTSAQVMAGGAVGKETIAENGAAVGYGAESMDGSATGSGAVTDAGGAAGSGANSLDGGAVGNTAQTDDGGAVGKNAQSSYGGAVGSGAKTGDGFAGGYEAKTTDSAGERIDAIQLGTGTNETPKTLQIYDYRLMNADGTIPSERLSGYYTKDEIDEATTELSNGISDKIGKNDEVSVEISSGEIVDVTSTAWEALKSGLRADELLSSKADKSDVYTKDEIDDRLWNVQISETKDDPKVDLFSEGVAVPGPTIPTTIICPLNNTIRRYGEISSAQLMIVDGPTENVSDMDDTLYCGVIEFTSPSTASDITISGIYMTGIDCDNGTFTPQANRRYHLKIVWDGLGYFGEVVGRPV